MGLSSAESGREVTVQMEIGEFLTKLVGEREKFAEAAGRKGDFNQENHELAAVEAVRDLVALVKPNVLYGEKINEDVMSIVEQGIDQSLFMPNEKNRLYDHNRVSLMAIATYLNSLG